MVTGSCQVHGPIHSTSRIYVVPEEIDQDSSNVQAREHMPRNLVKHVKEFSAKKKNSFGQKKKPELDNAGKLRGTYDIDREDKEFSGTLENAPEEVGIAYGLSNAV